MTTSQVRKRRLALLLAAVPGIAAAWGVLALTDPPGPGLDPDALEYVGAAVSLAHGRGLRVPAARWTSADSTMPLVHFPPAFPVAIATGIRLGATPMNAARFVEAAAACATVIAVALAAAAAGGPIAAIGAIAIAAATPATVIVHSSVLSEPLFLALLTWFTLALAADWRGRSTRRVLVLGALATVAALVRYAGASLVLVVLLDAFFGRPYAGDLAVEPADGWRSRLRRTATSAVLPLLALGVWVLSRPRAEDAERIREAGLYTRGMGSTFAEGAATIREWLAPGITPELAMTIVALAVVAGIIALFARAARVVWKGGGMAGEVRVYRATELVGACYAFVLLASRLTADPGIPLDERMLAPLFLLAALAIGVALASWWRDCARAGRAGALILTLGFALSWLAGTAERSAQLVNEFRTDGADLASEGWRDSPLVRWAAGAAPGTRIYTNWPSAIWFHTGRAAVELPAHVDAETMQAFREKLAREHGVVLGFRAGSPDTAPPDSLARLAGLVELAHWPDGSLWTSPPEAAGATRRDSLLVFPAKVLRVE